MQRREWRPAEAEAEADADADGEGQTQTRAPIASAQKRNSRTRERDGELPSCTALIETHSWPVGVWTAQNSLRDRRLCAGPASLQLPALRTPRSIAIL